MADLDHRQPKVHSGDYDDFMLASLQARQRVDAANGKDQELISDLQEFVRRFSANASKARQATSRRRELEKITLEEVRPSPRQNPYIRFEQRKKLFHCAVSIEGLSFRYPGSDGDALQKVSLNIRACERIAIIGAHGVGKTTRCLIGELKPTAGQIS